MHLCNVICHHRWVIKIKPIYIKNIPLLDFYQSSTYFSTKFSFGVRNFSFFRKRIKDIFGRTYHSSKTENFLRRLLQSADALAGIGGLFSPPEGPSLQISRQFRIIL